MGTHGPTVGMICAAVCALVVSLLAFGTVPVAHAAMPTGMTGWCTVLPAGQKACFSSPYAACERQHQAYGLPAAFKGEEDSGYIYSRNCKWPVLDPNGAPYVNSGPAQVYFECAPGYVRVPPGFCKLETEDFTNCSSSCAAPVPTTPNPVNLLSGGKQFAVDDFRTAEGGLALSRRFTSVSYGGWGARLVNVPQALANWTFDFQYELQISDQTFYDKQVVVASPRGGAYPFQVLPSGAVVSAPTLARPEPQFNYRLELLTPTAGNLRTVPTRWRLTDADDNRWILETYLDPVVGRYLIARPISVTSREGYQRVFRYNSTWQLVALTDSYGRTISFEWAGRNVTKATLPGGNIVSYTYDLTDSAGVVGRLTEVNIRNSVGTLLDKTTYSYNDPFYPSFVTDVRDKDGVVRWVVEYDEQARATKSSGPSGVDAVTITYANSGPGGLGYFSRTVTNALGKVSTYRFTRNPAYYDVRFVGVDTAASANTPATTSAHTYDTNGRSGGSVDEEGRSTTYSYDASGRGAQVKEASATPSERLTVSTFGTDVRTPTQVVKPGLTTSLTYETAADPDPSDASAISTTGHAYWRLRMLSHRSSGDYHQISKIQFRSSVGGADLATGGSPIESGGGGAAKAFDNDDATRWDPPLPIFETWVGYQFASPVAINEVLVRSTSFYKPIDFVVESSDDGITWALEWYVLDQNWLLSDQVIAGRTASPSKTGAYADWRVRVWRSELASSALAGVAELQFRATAGGPNQAAGGAAIYSGSTASTAASNAFDGSASTRWYMQDSAWTSALGYSFPAPVSVAQVAIQATTTPTHTPKHFAIQYYSGGRWHVAKEVRGATGWTSGEVRTFATP